MEKGEGVEELYPSLIGPQIVDDYTSIPCYIRYGKQDTSSLLKMMPLPSLSEVEITNIVNFIVHDLNNSDKTLFLEDTKSIVSKCKQ